VRVAVVNTQVLFVRGGAEQLADGLVGALQGAGHEVSSIRLPFRWHPDDRILDHMLAAQLTTIPDADLVIALKFPAYHVSHARKVLWILHQHRQAYDLWGTPWQGIADDGHGRSVRRAIHDTDERLLQETTHGPHVISENVASRMRASHDVSPSVLYPPLMDVGYFCAEAEDYVFYPSRINVLKRQTLVVEAMRHVRSGVRLILAGTADTPEIEAEMESLLDDPVLQDRVRWLNRWVSHADKLDLLARSLGTVFTPVDEDYGYVTLESFTSDKPVITCVDSGGPLEFVTPGVTGLIADPEPESIAAAIDALAGDREAAVRMGQAGGEQLRERDISWSHVLDTLLST
jgi:glycosyltransferase involved in cell wall biosynthesis